MVATHRRWFCPPLAGVAEGRGWSGRRSPTQTTITYKVRPSTPGCADPASGVQTASYSFSTFFTMRSPSTTTSSIYTPAGSLLRSRILVYE